MRVKIAQIGTYVKGIIVTIIDACPIMCRPSHR